MLDLEALKRAVDAHTRVARVLVAETRGSTPREAGADMLMWADGQSGTIGGGRLEYEAVARARAMLAEGRDKALRRQPLGPALRQCCGGAVTLLTEVFDAVALDGLTVTADVRVVQVEPGEADLPAPLDRRLRRAETAGTPFATTLDKGWLAEPVRRPGTPVLIHGAGHVGRALAAVLAPLPRFAVTLADPRDDLCRDLPQGVSRADDYTAAMDAADDTAIHYIMTPDHEADLALCDRLLRREFAHAGLIGSATKWARFRSRLRALGHAEPQIARIQCPIGDPALGKHPQAIAVGVVQQLLSQKDRTEAQKGLRA